MPHQDETQPRKMFLNSKRREENHMTRSPWRPPATQLRRFCLSTTAAFPLTHNFFPPQPTQHIPSAIMNTPHPGEKKEEHEHVEHSNLETMDSLEKGAPAYVIDPVLEKTTMHVLLLSCLVCGRSLRSRTWSISVLDSGLPGLTLFPFFLDASSVRALRRQVDRRVLPILGALYGESVRCERRRGNIADCALFSLRAVISHRSHWSVPISFSAHSHLILTLILCTDRTNISLARAAGSESGFKV